MSQLTSHTLRIRMSSAVKYPHPSKLTAGSGPGCSIQCGHRGGARKRVSPREIIYATNNDISRQGTT